MKGSSRGNWDPREGQQPFRPNPNGVGDRTTTLRRQLIGATTPLLAWEVIEVAVVKMLYIYDDHLLHLLLLLVPCRALKKSNIISILIKNLILVDVFD